MSQSFATPIQRIPHPFAADYSPRRPRTRPSFPFTGVSNITHTRIPSPAPPPSCAVPPVPSASPFSAVAKRARAPRSTTATRPTPTRPAPRVPISAPVPLSSPPPPVYQPVVQPSHTSRSSSNLLRPDSRIQRERKKAKNVSPWDLKHVRASSPASKDLWTLFEVDEDWVRITEELQNRPVSYAYLAPYILTNPSTPCRKTPSPANLFLSAKPSSEVLAPSPPISALSVRIETEYNEGAMETLTDSESTVNHIITPNMEDEDPFALDGVWHDSPVRQSRFGASPTDSARNPRIRRPFPLTLGSSNKSRPSSYSSLTLADEGADYSPPISPSPAGRSRKSPKLLSPIAIASPGVQQARRRSASGPPDITPPRAKRASHGRPDFPPTPLDLESALEDFLACCGERSSDLETGSFSDSDGESMSDTDLFYQRPKSFGYTSSEDEGRTEAFLSGVSTFPLPLPREYTPPRHRPASTQLLGLGIDLGSPTIFSLGSSETPVTPPPMHRRQLLPSLPIVPTPTSRHKADRRPPVKLPSNHSFLQSLSRGEEPFLTSPSSSITSCPVSTASQVSSLGPYSSGGSASSAGSGSSGRSLPKRGAIPASWKLFAATNRI